MHDANYNNNKKIKLKGDEPSVSSFRDVETKQEFQTSNVKILREGKSKLPLVASAVGRNACTRGQETQPAFENSGKKKQNLRRLKKKLPQLLFQCGNKRWRNKPRNK
ncbi:hypothetical protein CY35_13G043200 [Sphagnum magellanicum]|nr:hypothetical protein CY35_13G043200 [Sphagnum magellanicum]